MLKTYHPGIAGDILWRFDPSVSGPGFLGFIPDFVSQRDPRPAIEQINAGYIGGWNQFHGFTMDPVDGTLSYAGDPPLRPRAECVLPATELRGEERILIYDYAWCAVVHGDGSYDVARID